MKFPRNARIFRGQFDAAPFASVFFLLVIFAVLSSLVYTPGVRLRLPQAGGWTPQDGLPGVEGPAVSVALVTNRYYFQNQSIAEPELKHRLQEAVKQAPEPLTLVVLSDKDVSYESLIHLGMLAEQAGIHKPLLLATLPRPFDARPPVSARSP